MRITITTDQVAQIEHALNHDKTVEIKIEHSKPVVIEISRKIVSAVTKG